MTLQNIAGAGLWIPRPNLAPVSALASISGVSIISANTSAKMAFCGRVWNKDHATKNIQKIGFRFNALTKANGFTVQVSVQGVSTANGPPIQPDGTILASTNAKITFADTDSGVTASGWFDTANLTSAPSVTYGQMIAVVWEWITPGTGNSVALAGIIGSQSEHQAQMVSTTDGTTWTSNVAIPNVVLEFDDGTFGTLDGGVVFSAIDSTAYQSGTNPNEHGLVFQLPFPAKIDGCWLALQLGNAASTATVELTDSSGSVINSCSVTFDGHQVVSTGFRPIFVPLPETSLTANTDYYLGVLATAAQNVSFPDFSVNAANHLQATEGGANFRYSSRNGDSWAAVTTTRRPFGGIRLSALDDAAGGGAAGMLYVPGMAGGMEG